MRLNSSQLLLLALFFILKNDCTAATATATSKPNRKGYNVRWSDGFVTDKPSTEAYLQLPATKVASRQQAKEESRRKKEAEAKKEEELLSRGVISLLIDLFSSFLEELVDFSSSGTIHTLFDQRFFSLIYKDLIETTTIKIRPSYNDITKFALAFEYFKQAVPKSRNGLPSDWLDLHVCICLQELLTFICFPLLVTDVQDPIQSKNERMMHAAREFIQEHLQVFSDDFDQVAGEVLEALAAKRLIAKIPKDIQIKGMILHAYLMSPRVETSKKEAFLAALSACEPGEIELTQDCTDIVMCLAQQKIVLQGLQDLAFRFK